MAEAAPKTNLLGMDREGLERFFASLGEKPFRARQLLQWIYKRGVTDFEAMSDLSRGLRMRLSGLAEIRPPAVLREQLSADGTVKWLMSLPGGNVVETVFIPEPDRATLCISSQVGCMLNCTFCSTAMQGFARNLSAAEIIGQVWLGSERTGGRRITNVVLMGMGEPLLNLDQVRPALGLLRDDLAYGLAARRVTVSTAGVVPGIDALREAPAIALAVSLHAPDDELRSRLVPLNRKYPIAELLAACRRYLAERRPKQSITFEYTMIDGVNDSPELARQLLRVLANVPSKINLIPFNPFPGTPFRCSSPERMLRFQEILRAGGLIATIRKTRGDDIDAACGQLVGKVLSSSGRRALVQQQLARQAVVA
ncbi:MAG: 23S rRNA (adenine(2503)-C(2))-methyltransferase RlmN [Wenzhouxiangellaceae bacterium]|nr:23S rRNA (adenine(2503)-C(2))-methyltransferase RlmN [Wenzhouxiangellaceae bacterium]